MALRPNAASAESVKSTPSTIVALKSVFSSPRRVWKPELKLSAPNAPPKDAPVRCSKTDAIKRIARMICTYGSAVWRRPIDGHPSTRGVGDAIALARSAEKMIITYVIYMST